jgi:hypothetical protein
MQQCDVALLRAAVSVAHERIDPALVPPLMALCVTTPAALLGTLELAARLLACFPEESRTHAPQLTASFLALDTSAAAHAVESSVRRQLSTPSPTSDAESGRRHAPMGGPLFSCLCDVATLLLAHDSSVSEQQHDGHLVHDTQHVCDRQQARHGDGWRRNSEHDADIEHDANVKHDADIQCDALVVCDALANGSAFNFAGLPAEAAAHGAPSEAVALVDSLLGVSDHFGGRLPELLAGVSRTELPTPAVYPTSCLPQAWAAASPLLALRTLLGLEPDVPNGVVHLDPVLLDGCTRLRLHHTPVGTLSVETVGGAWGVGAPSVVAEGLPDGCAVRAARPETLT